MPTLHTLVFSWALWLCDSVLCPGDVAEPFPAQCLYQCRPTMPTLTTSHMAPLLRLYPGPSLMPLHTPGRDLVTADPRKTTENSASTLKTLCICRLSKSLRQHKPRSGLTSYIRRCCCFDLSRTLMPDSSQNRTLRQTQSKVGFCPSETQSYDHSV